MMKTTTKKTQTIASTGTLEAWKELNTYAPGNMCLIMKDTPRVNSAPVLRSIIVTGGN